MMDPVTTVVHRGVVPQIREVAGPTPDRPDHHFPTHLNASDTLMWTIERDPCLRSTIVAVSLMDRSPDWDRLRARIVSACDLIPRLRQHVEMVPFRLGLPRWEVDEFFDVDYHLRRTLAPAPGDLRSVLDIAALMAMTAFDKDRPLWEFTLVEGLDGGRAAFIQKVHHSVTDGVGGVKLAKILLDETRRTPAVSATPRVAGHTPRGGLAAVAESLADDARALLEISARGARALPGISGRAIMNPGRQAMSLSRQMRSIAKLLAPVTKARSPIMTQRGLSRRFDSFDVRIEEMMAAAHAADSSLNDAFLAGVAGGMRRYHERHGAPVDALRVTMPINLRRAGDPPGSNRFTPARFTLPVGTVDARDRMLQLGLLARGWRKEPSLPMTDVIAAALIRLPAVAATSILGSMLKAIDFVATNVPGPRHRTYLAGAEVVREYAFAPASGAAFSVALMSHVDHCCIGINADISAVPDPEILTACVVEGFEEVLAIGRK